MEKATEFALELLKRLKPAYSVPAILLILFSWWRVSAFDEVRLRDIPTDLWILIATALVILWLPIYAFVQWRWSDKAKPTPVGKTGFFVARIEGDSGNKQQNDFMAVLHDAFSKKPELANTMYVGDLRVSLPHGSADDQAAAAHRLGLRANATEIIWIVHGVGKTYVYHTPTTKIEKDKLPRAIGVPQDSQIERYFGTLALQYAQGPGQITVPRFVRNLGLAQIAANEASTVGKVRLIINCAVTFQVGHPSMGFPSNLYEMGPDGDRCLDSGTASGMGNGYKFGYRPTHPVGKVNTGFEVVARPTGYDTTGIRSFYADESGVIRFTAENRSATILDPPL